MITAVAGFHITLYSVPSMRLQRRPSAASRCSRGRSWEWRPYPWTPPSLFTRRVHRRVIASAAAGGPKPPGGPGEDQQHDDNGPDPRTTRGLSLEFIVRPSDRSARLSFVPVVGCGLRRVHLGGAAGSDQERRPAPSVHPDRCASDPGLGTEPG